MKEVIIGNQIWMAENLNTLKFRDGSEIFLCKDSKQWESLNKKSKPAACALDFDSSNIDKFGLLYNWYAVADTKLLAPEGFRISSYEDWKILIGENNMSKFGANLKSKEYWENSKKNNNSSGFCALPAGSLAMGDFQKIGSSFWTSKDGSIDGFAISVTILDENHKISFGSNFKDFGFSVRCVKS